MKTLAVIVLFCFTSALGARTLSTYEKDVTLTRSQRQTLDKFKKIMRDRLPQSYMKEDIYLVRWLRAKDFNLKEAEEFLMDNLQWRKVTNMDNVLNEDFSDIRRDFKYSLETRDKEGQPNLYLDVGSMDIRAAILAGKRERLIRYVDRAYEQSAALIRKLGHTYRNVTRGNLIVNLQGFSTEQHACLQCMSSIVRMLLSYESHYPLLADRIIAVNTPEVFTPLLETARSAISENTARTLRVFGTNRVKNLKYLLTFTDIEQIPVELGGNKILTALEVDE